MQAFTEELKQTGFTGEIDESLETRNFYSHDASLFELVPEVVVHPKNTQDVQKIVSYVAEHKKTDPNISITPRSAGTDMSGGAVGQSIVLEMTKHFNKIQAVTSKSARTQPGVFYRDFEKATFEHDALLPCYPASRDLCTVGGMVSNNSGGEKSLKYGKTERFVKKLHVVLADGNEYEVESLNKEQLDKKMALKTFEGQLYKEIFEIVDKHYDLIKAAKPKVSKDSTAYHLWNVWDRETGIFDMTQLIVGSQGTLGIVTDIEFRLIQKPAYSGTLVVFLRDIGKLGDLIPTVMKYEPTEFEGFDNYTLMLSFKLFYYFHQTLGWGGMAKLGIQLIPDAFKLFRGIPKMVLLIEFDGQTDQEVRNKVHAMRLHLKQFGHDALFEEDPSESSAKKFWIMRRESFNLLRKKVHDKHTAPFIDDLVVPSQHLVTFLPQLRKIINKYGLLATVAGHMGDGNFHVIPLMKIELPNERKKLRPAMTEVNNLVLHYGGSISGEHNDGMIRGPWLPQMYKPEMMKLFRQVKTTFDKDNIFNPHKKTDATWEFSMAHIREKF